MEMQMRNKCTLTETLIDIQDNCRFGICTFHPPRTDLSLRYYCLNVNKAYKLVKFRLGIWLASL